MRAEILPDDPTAQDEALARLAEWLRPALANRPVCVGIVGPPGCGKSTLARRLLVKLQLEHSLSVSLDDFYLEPAERRARGFAFRGPPGTHDSRLLEQFLDELAAFGSTLTVPRYDRDHEQRLPPRSVAGPVSLCLIEGWFVGARVAGYERLCDSLERLIYLDMEIGEAREARLLREAELRARGAGGMNEAETVRFWNEALAPHLETLVLPLRERADAVLALDGQHHITALTLREEGDYTAQP